MRYLLILACLVSCTPAPKEPKGCRDGYRMYKGRTAVKVTIDPKIPNVEPDYPHE